MVKSVVDITKLDLSQGIQIDDKNYLQATEYFKSLDSNGDNHLTIDELAKADRNGDHFFSTADAPDLPAYAITQIVKVLQRQPAAVLADTFSGYTLRWPTQSSGCVTPTLKSIVRENLAGLQDMIAKGFLDQEAPEGIDPVSIPVAILLPYPLSVKPGRDAKNKLVAFDSVEDVPPAWCEQFDTADRDAAFELVSDTYKSVKESHPDFDNAQLVAAMIDLIK